MLLALVTLLAGLPFRVEATLAGFFFAPLLLSFTSTGSSSAKPFASKAFWALFWCSSCRDRQAVNVPSSTECAWRQTHAAL